MAKLSEKQKAMWGVFERDLADGRKFDRMYVAAGLRHGLSLEEAEELVSEFRLRMVNYADYYKYKITEKTKVISPRLKRWFNSCFPKHMINFFRKKKTRREFPGDEDLQEFILDTPYLDNPLDKLERVEITEELERAIGNLPERYRIPLVMRYYLGLERRRISYELEIPVWIVGYRIRAAKKELRKNRRLQDYSRK